METITVSKVAVAIMCMVAVLSLSAPLAVEGLTCGQVASSLGPCLNYLKVGGVVPPGCCSGVKSLSGIATTPADRKQACTCLKSISGSVTGINAGLAAGLPGKCGVSVPYKISPSTDCSQVQ
ncbi:Non-specific lipid-transfer protein [Heracleum sosnowskyi]|uniref:Non-specific lipid-transfer protein n=1 Tax=Heracleum sosnowskyi TaxID=360622 RepID=A0AAD8GVX7_9APIA|nr:Non-specific lipid-transfer protein [Heracleum sosnowskyi]